MAETETLLLDISHYQGKNIRWDVMRKAGVRGVYIKSSQGSSYRDPRFEANVRDAQSEGILAGPYHFMTPEPAQEQLENWLRAIEGQRIDLAPAMDCEKYSGGVTKAEIVDQVGLKVAEWMRGRGMREPELPPIYTNQDSGNLIFKTPKHKAMRRYPLWVASWWTSVPALPLVWKGAAYYLWQYGVVEGAGYGIDGKADVNRWGNLIPFPGEDPEDEPTPAPETVQTTVTLKGVKYRVTFEEIKEP